jgi:hypothetical protein
MREGFFAEQDKRDYCKNTEEKGNTSFFKEETEQGKKPQRKKVALQKGSEETVLTSSGKHGDINN